VLLQPRVAIPTVAGVDSSRLVVLLAHRPGDTGVQRGRIGDGPVGIDRPIESIHRFEYVVLVLHLRHNDWTSIGGKQRSVVV